MKLHSFATLLKDEELYTQDMWPRRDKKDSLTFINGITKFTSTFHPLLQKASGFLSQSRQWKLLRHWRGHQLNVNCCYSSFYSPFHLFMKLLGFHRGWTRLEGHGFFFLLLIEKSLGGDSGIFLPQDKEWKQQICQCGTDWKVKKLNSWKNQI